MKAIIFEKFGGTEVLEYRDVPEPQPEESEVLIRISAAGVNPVDWKIREGKLQARIPNFLPIIPGWEFSGTVQSRGFGARRFEIGDEVFSYCRRTRIEKGAYAEYISIPESYLALKPKSISHEEAAGIPLSGLSAYQSMFQVANLEKGELVLILGASGGVGSYAVQLAKEKGARIVAVASARNESYVRSLGADDFIDYSQGSIFESFLKKYPDGADLVLDYVGGETFTQGGVCAKPGRPLVSLLTTDFPASSGYNGIYHFAEPNAKQLETLATLVDSGKIKVNISEIFPLRDAALAQDKISKLHTRGKIVLKI